MVNPGSFHGSRKDFLLAQANLYADAVVNSHVLDTVADVQRRYFKRYPPSLPDDEEPSAEWLAAVDDNSPDDEILPPRRDGMDEKEYDQALEHYHQMLKVIETRKGVSISIFLLYM